MQTILLRSLIAQRRKDGGKVGTKAFGKDGERVASMMERVAAGNRIDDPMATRAVALHHRLTLGTETIR